MARLFEDGYDHYGLTESFLLDAVYANANTGALALSTAQAATGTHSILFNGEADLDQPPLRKVLPSGNTKMGITDRYYFPNLPNVNTGAMIMGFMTATPTLAHIGVFADANGCLRFYRGTNFADNDTGKEGTLLATTDPIITAAAWNHIEVQVNISNTVGWFRVAVNGVHRYASATDLDTMENSDNIVSIGHGKLWDQGYTGDFYMDDVIYYDFTGTAATDTDFCPTVDGSGVATNYIGELQVWWLQPNGDTAEDDWAPSTGTDAYAMVDEVDPNDADYISSTAANDLSEFDLTDLPVEITYIRGLTVWGRMSKSDSGAAMVKYGMKSVAATSDSDEFPITVAPAYWTKQINVDPNSSARWTRTSLNAAWMRLIRSV